MSGSRQKNNDCSFRWNVRLPPLLIHRHLEAFSAASVINLIDVVLFLPATQTSLRLYKATEPWTSAANFNSVTVSLPSIHPTLLNKLPIFSELPFVGLCHIFLPRYRHLPHDHLLTSYTKQESCQAKVVFEQNDQGISAAHPDQQITPNMVLC